jgi:NAD(P)-dependent dehydrogenase (short-subunit alcohol dehydrogenase family)
VIADVREDHLKDARAWFVSQKQSRRIKCLKLDVTNRKAYARAAVQAEIAFGKIHVLVNNAGLGLLGAIDKTKYDDWDWGLSVMIGGVVNGILTVLPLIRAHGEGGHIVNTASMAAMIPIPNCSIYITAKSALVGLSECLAGELAPANIGVSAFCPGPCRATSASSASCGRTSTRRTRARGVREAARAAADRRACGWTRWSAGSAWCAASSATTCTSSRTRSSKRAPRTLRQDAGVVPGRAHQRAARRRHQVPAVEPDLQMTARRSAGATCAGARGEYSRQCATFDPVAGGGAVRLWRRGGGSPAVRRPPPARSHSLRSVARPGPTSAAMPSTPRRVPWLHRR